MKTEQRLEKAIQIIFIGMTVFFVFSFICTRYKALPYPIGDFMFLPSDTFMDFINVNEMASKLDPYFTWGSSYPPAMIMVAWVFSRFANYTDYSAKEVVEQAAGKVSYTLFIVITFVAIVVLLYHLLKPYLTDKKKLCVGILCLLFNAPYMYAVDRGNYILLVIPIFLACLLLYEKHPYIAAMLLGIIAAMKIYPLFLILFYFINKRYKEMGIMILSGGVVTMVPLFFFDHPWYDNIYQFMAAVFRFGSGMNGLGSTTGFSVGFTSLLRLPYAFFHNGQEPDSSPVMMIFLIAGTVLALWSIRNLWKEESRVRQLVVLTALMVFLTPNSYLYNVLYLLGPLVLMMTSIETFNAWDKKAFICLALLFIPKAYYYAPLEGTNYISIAVLFDSLLLLGIIVYYNIFQEMERIKKKRG